MLQPVSLDLVVKAQAIALLGIVEWLSERDDVSADIKHSLVQVLTTTPILLGRDLGPEAEAEMKEKANAILTKIVGQPLL
jgi:hypothetical protein